MPIHKTLLPPRLHLSHLSHTSTFLSPPPHVSTLHLDLDLQSRLDGQSAWTESNSAAAPQFIQSMENSRSFYSPVNH
eukprot:g76162.t1